MEIRKRFWSKVKKTDTCWLWEAGLRNKHGYGGFTHNKSWVLAHRVAYELTYGVFDEKLCVLHKCDNTLCVNPEHLFLGTHEDNMADKRAKGRGRSARGEDHPSSVLTEVQVRQIRSLLGENNTIAHLARLFEVGESTIRHIKTGHTWKNVL